MNTPDRIKTVPVLAENIPAPPNTKFPVTANENIATKELEKQLKQKTRELKSLAKEIKGKRKKRSGAVITDDITRATEEKAILEDQVNTGNTLG